ncbi:MAG: TRAP transporter substrate-binding protein DctP, partial [Anaerovorax sp.]|nr:TRAP transporter substrate-binding protein DctP [Anaerovorax sp.]
MKRKLSVVLVMILVLSCSLIGCGGKENAEPADSSDVSYLIRVAHVLPTDHATHITAEEVFKKEVEENSNGRIKVEVYPNGQLGGDRQTIEALNLGTVEMCIPGGTVLSGFVEDFMVLDLPFLFKSKEDAFKVLDGKVGDTLNTKLEE